MTNKKRNENRQKKGTQHKKQIQRIKKKIEVVRMTIQFNKKNKNK